MPIAALQDLPPDRPMQVRVNERFLAAVRCAEGGPSHVLDDPCPHRGGQLSDGTVRGEDIICPLHGYEFDLSTGVSRYNVAECISVFPTRVIEGQAI